MSAVAEIPTTEVPGAYGYAAPRASGCRSKSRYVAALAYADRAREPGAVLALQVSAAPALEVWLGRFEVAAPELASAGTLLTVGHAIESTDETFFFRRDRPIDNETIDALSRAFSDPVIRHLGQSLAPSLRDRDHADPAFLEFACSALQACIVSRLGLSANRSHRTGGLAGWQLRRVRELLLARLADNIPIAELASACRLSPSHFIRGFRKSTGLSPHQWVVMRRIDRCKDLLVERAAHPLAEIALACGFADQSHFTRTFSRIVGMSPGAWRRWALGSLPLVRPGAPAH